MSSIFNGIKEAKRSPEPDYDDPSWDEKVSNVGQKAKQAQALKAKGKEPRTRWNPETKKYYVDFSDDDVQKESVGLPYPGTYEETNDMFKGSGQRRVAALTNEEELNELSCWSGYHRVAGTKAGFPGSCAKNKTNEEQLDELDMFAPRTVYFKMADGNYIKADYRGTQGLSGHKGNDNVTFTAMSWVPPNTARTLGLDKFLAKGSDPNLGTVRQNAQSIVGTSSPGEGPLGNRTIDVVDFVNGKEDTVPSALKTQVMQWVQKNQSKPQAPAQGVAESKEDKIKQLQQDYATAVHWSKNDTNPHKREAARQKAEKIKAHLEKQYKQGVAEGSTETTQQQQVRAAISKGLEVHKQKGDAEYKTRLDRSNKVGTVPGHYFDNRGYASDKLTGIDSIDPDGTVVTSLNDTDAEGWVKKLATLGGMPGVKTRALQSPTASSRSLAEEKCPHCGGVMVSEELMNEKKDACYYKVKSRYKVWPSAYASGALVKCRKSHGSWGNGGKKNESSILEGIARADENLHKWFKEKWVRFGPDGKIRGDCARGDDSEGKPKCLPQSKAQNLGKKGRASAAARKRREDPNPERSGKAINVNTKKK
jgi:hypothetical protein